jgi:hypothetical protein
MTRIIMVVGVFFALTANSADAQSREGFWIGFGVGGGGYTDMDLSGRETGGVAYLKLGGTLSERFLLGVESNAWVKEVSGIDLTATNFSAVAYFYPSATGSFFLKLGLGVATQSASVGSASVSINGTGGVFGLGYDRRIGDNWSITPFLNSNVGRFDGGDSSIIELGVGVTWH